MAERRVSAMTEPTQSLYGIRNGQIYGPADGSTRRLLVLDCEAYAACSDVVVRDMATNVEFRIDAFKLAMVRYTLVGQVASGPMNTIWIDPFDLYTPHNPEATSPDYLGITRDVAEGT